MKSDWFTSWFNTRYYHLLYKDRNDMEAELFMKNITEFLQLPTSHHIIDIPCGKGRHSIYLNSLGYTVTGADLSENSIRFAKQFETNNLHFEVRDMRKPYKNTYNAIFNLFTSFGYFETDKEDITILKNMKNGLKKDGVLVLDFLNVDKLKNSLITEEIKAVDGIDFHIQREIKNGFILKHIHFYADEKQHSYTERVKYIDIDTFKDFFNQVGLEITHIFGDYKLSTFNKEISNRLILVAK